MGIFAIAIWERARFRFWIIRCKSKISQCKASALARLNVNTCFFELLFWSFPLSVSATTIRPVRWITRVRTATIGRQLLMVLTTRTTCTSIAAVWTWIGTISVTVIACVVSAKNLRRWCFVYNQGCGEGRAASLFRTASRECPVNSAGYWGCKILSRKNGRVIRMPCTAFCKHLLGLRFPFWSFLLSVTATRTVRWTVTWVRTETIGRQLRTVLTTRTIWTSIAVMWTRRIPTISRTVLACVVSAKNLRPWFF